MHRCLAFVALLLVACDGTSAVPDGGDARDRDGGPMTAHDGGGAGSDAGPIVDGGSTDRDAGPERPAGEHTFVAVGNWGYRARTVDGVSWAYCGNASTGNDHSPDLLRAVGYGDGVFIAVGGDANSMVMRSVDGEHWEEDLHPTDSCPGETYPPSCRNWMGGVAYGDGVWLAGGGNGALMRSTDGGRTWTGIKPDPTPSAIRSIGFGDGVFVAGTDSGAVIVSDDGGDSFTAHTVWTSAPAIAFGGGTFIAKGRSWNGSGFDYGCAVSTDLGDTWDACAAELLEAGPAVHDGARWVARVDGGYITSANGVVWTSHTASDFPNEYLFNGTFWVGQAGSDIRTSTDLDTWTGAATGVDGWRSWVGGRVYDSNLPVTGVPACQDNR